MPLKYWIDNEVPDRGEWSSRLQDLPSTIIQTSAAAWGDRVKTGTSGYGLRTTISGNNNEAYVQKNLSHTIDPAAQAWWAINSARVPGAV